MDELKNKDFGRRQILKSVGLGVLALAGTGVSSRSVLATPDKASEYLSKLTSGASSTKGKVTVKLPEIAENGNQVKVSFDIDSPMSNDDCVNTVYLLADGNPAPNVAKFSFTTDMGACSATTRMRLSKTQNIYLLAEYNNGNFAMTKSKVKVTIGGCGG